jgi:hypothetical protein
MGELKGEDEDGRMKDEGEASTALASCFILPLLSGY